MEIIGAILGVLAIVIHLAEASLYHGFFSGKTSWLEREMLEACGDKSQRH
ncbi:MAG: hypothetical protein ACPGR2_10445 [Psychrobium sp.]